MKNQVTSNGYIKYSFLNTGFLKHYLILDGLLQEFFFKLSMDSKRGTVRTDAS